MLQAAVALDAIGATDVDFHSLLPYNGSRAHIVPLMQAGLTPSQDKGFVQRSQTGFGITAFGIQYLADDDPSNPSNKLRFAGEVLLQPSAAKLARTDDQKRNQSIGAIVFDATAVNLCVKAVDADDGWKFCVPSLSTGAAIAPIQCSFSATKVGRFDAKNVIGFYDFEKMPMVAHELCPFMPQLFFTNEYDKVATASGFGIEASSTQPALATNFGGSRPGEAIHNIWDMISGISTVGIRLSAEFVKKHAVHAEDGSVITKEPFQQLGMTAPDGKSLLPPAPPTLERNGYVSINAIAETNFAAKIRKAPENTASVDFYAVFEGCSALAADAPHPHELANASEAAGEAVLLHALAEKYADKDVATAIRDHVALYAVASAKKATPVTPSKKREADSSEDESGASDAKKKAKSAASDDDEAE